MHGLFILAISMNNGYIYVIPPTIHLFSGYLDPLN
jgi:hypothetical protein